MVACLLCLLCCERWFDFVGVGLRWCLLIVLVCHGFYSYFVVSGIFSWFVLEDWL